MKQKIIHLSLAHPWLVIVFCAIVIIVAGMGGLRLQPTTDYRVFFSKDNPEMLAFEALQSKYTRNDNIMFVVAPKNGDIFTQKNIGIVQFITDQAWKTPSSVRVDSITNYQHSYAEDDDLIVEKLVPKRISKLTPERLQRIREIALGEPLLVRRLISESGHVAGVNVSIVLPDDPTPDQVIAIGDFAKQLADQVETEHPEVTIHLTGVKMIDQAFLDASIKDATQLFPLMFVLVVVLVGLFFRSPLSVFNTLLIILLSIISTMGIAGWLDIRLSTPVMSVPTIVLTLAVADCVHIYTNYFINLRNGEKSLDGLTHSLEMNIQPIFITSITTSLGFLTMNFSDSPPFRDLGNLVAIGVMIAFVLSVMLLPAIIKLCPLPKKLPTLQYTVWMEKLAQFVTYRYRFLLVIMLALCVFLTNALFKNEINDEFVKYFDETNAFRIATDFANENLTGLYMFEYDAVSGEPQGMTQPKFLAYIEAFSLWARSQPEVKHVMTITDLLKRLNRDMHAGDPAWYKMPNNDELVAQYLLLYELSLPRGLDLNNQIDMHKTATRITVTTGNLSTKQMLAFERKTYRWQQENWPKALWTHGTGSTMMFANIGERNIKSMLTGTVIALFLISGLLIFIFRSLKLGLVSLVPNLVPPVLAFGLWGLFVGKVGLGLASVMGMVLGIIVDDTIHFLSKYQSACKRDLSTVGAIKYAFANVGPALLITTVVLTAGFLVLAMSDFALTSDLGLLTACAITIALITDFFLLPPLLILLDKWGSNKP